MRGLLVLTGVMIALMTVMGVWQLSRAEEKRQLQLEWDSRSQIELELAEALAVNAPFGHRLRVSGVYLAGGDLFLDNQIEQGRVGYRLVRPLQTAAGLLAVDLGWVEAGADRRRLPVVSPPDEDSIELSGFIVRPYLPPLSLSSHRQDLVSARVQSLQPELLARQWGEPVQPFVLKLVEGDALESGWQPVVMGPERHTGYAIQWFVMALAVLITGLMFYRRWHEA
ncbi:SURF1 family protein [Zobellella aerophila]|uniref:SURF1-like protein n=2 Tax=Zobellella aerophila TaxID=870480 RepID=A0ABP6W3T1_9GAMM